MEPAHVDPFAATPTVEVAPVRGGQDLDWEAIAAFLRGHLPNDIDTTGSFDVLQFPHGSANLTYLISFGATELVLRRPPFGTLAPGAHDMAREYKVLSRLWRHFDKAPRAFVFCDDHDIGGADFFVMERVCGAVVRGVVPPSLRQHEDIGRRLGFALVDAMAEMHLLDAETCGLADLGRPEGFVERQVHGWKKRWDLVANAEHDAAMAEVHARLVEALPAPQRVSLVHNDLKLDNVMFGADDPDRVIAIFDWDMTTLGDPLIDLGTLLNYWPEPSDPADSARGGHPGMESMGLPSRAEMSARYGTVSGLDLSIAPWYEAFAQWKTATVIQQLHHRWKVGDSTDDRMATVADRLPALVETAGRLLDS